MLSLRSRTGQRHLGTESESSCQSSAAPLESFTKGQVLLGTSSVPHHLPWGPPEPLLHLHQGWLSHPVETWLTRG